MSRIPCKEINRILSEAPGKAGIYVEDCSTGEVYTINSEMVVPSASTIKVPMLALLLHDAEQGLVELDAPHDIKDENRVPGGIIYDLDKNYRPTLRDLAKLMISLSDNIATNEIMDIIGIERFNRFWSDKGYKNTVLMRKMRDTDAILHGRNNFFSAGDAGRMMSEIAKGTLINAEISQAIFDIMATQKLRCNLPLMLPTVNDYPLPNGKVPEGEVLVSHKTGNIVGVNHDIGIFQLPDDRRYVVAAFTQGFEPAYESPLTIAKLSKAIYDALK